MPRDIPIIFSAPMVRALLDGRKTMTRRLAWAKAHRKANEPATRPSPWQKVQPGDRLWTRENLAGYWSRDIVDYEIKQGLVHQLGKEDRWFKYAADIEDDSLHKIPSIHMPRGASRLTLIVTDVKVERLNSISPQDAETEGVFRHVAPHSLDKVFRGDREATAVRYFRELWEKLHGAGSWDDNPDVAALTFRVVKANIDAPEAMAA